MESPDVLRIDALYRGEESIKRLPTPPKAEENLTDMGVLII
jgi:hypothetical protein